MHKKDKTCVQVSNFQLKGKDKLGVLDADGRIVGIWILDCTGSG
jgi:hypothetical protein